MDIILLERVAKLGQLGDVVRVKDGFARNFLLPQGKALRANKANLERFESNRAELIKTNDTKRGEAELLKETLDGTSWVLIRQASESFQLYGSVTARDVANAISEDGTPITRQQVKLDATIKALGVYPVAIALHPEVEATVAVNVARSEDEAELQAAAPAGPREAEPSVPAVEEAAPELAELMEEAAAAEAAEVVGAEAEPVEATEASAGAAAEPTAKAEDAGIGEADTDEAEEAEAKTE